MFEIIRDFFMFADTPLNAAIANYGMMLVFAFIFGTALLGLCSVSKGPLWTFYKLLDHWTYARKWTKCEKCDKRAFCYYGVCWLCKNGGYFCGMGCPACKQEQDERKAKKIEVLKQVEELRRAKTTVNRRAAVMATRKKYGEV